MEKGTYVINLEHSENTGTHWVVIFVKKDEVISFDSFGVEYITREIMKCIGINASKQVSLELKITTQ